MTRGLMCLGCWGEREKGDWQACGKHSREEKMHACCGGWETTEGCRPLGKSRCRWENHIRTYIKHVTGKCGQDSSCSGQSPEVGSYENGNETSGSIKGEGCVEWFKNYWVLKDSFPCKFWCFADRVSQYNLSN